MNAPPRIIYLNAADLPAFDEPFNEYREPYILKSDYAESGRGFRCEAVEILR